MSIFTSNLFLNYLLFFSIFAGSLWFYYYLGLYGFESSKPKKQYKKRVCAIIPTYNEDEKNLVDTIKSIQNCKEIDYFVFVDDGSKNNVKEVLRENLNPENYIICAKNGGKRQAQAEGMESIVKRFGLAYFDSVVMLDSDTTFEKDAIKNLIQRMQFEDVGAVTANVKVKNRTDNFLTRCLSAMYWSSSNIWRQAPANYGYMQVTNGQLSVYRFIYIYDLLPAYLNQTFMGQKCAFSDDRWFTQHLQTDYNLRVDYEPTAVAYTYVPNKFKNTWKMFLRWKKGSMRETLLVTKHLFRKPLLVIDCWANHLVSLMQLSIRLVIIYLAFIHPMIIIYYLLIITAVSIVYGFDMLINNPKEIPYRIGYSILNELIFGWITIQAIYTIKNQGWGTRK